MGRRSSSRLCGREIKGSGLKGGYAGDSDGSEDQSILRRRRRTDEVGEESP